MGDSRTAEKFVVRLPDGMRDQISDIAERNHRSMNSEIIARLEQSMLNGAQIQEQEQLIRQLSEMLELSRRTAQDLEHRLQASVAAHNKLLVRVNAQRREA